jgi:hypothetical protein
MSAIRQDLHTGEMVRQAIHGNAKSREIAYMRHEHRMLRVEEKESFYIETLHGWLPVVSEQTLLALVGWCAQGHGLSFYEALYLLYSNGDLALAEVLKDFSDSQRKGEGN